MSKLLKLVSICVLLSLNMERIEAFPKGKDEVAPVANATEKTNAKREQSKAVDPKAAVPVDKIEAKRDDTKDKKVSIEPVGESKDLDLQKDYPTEESLWCPGIVCSAPPEGSQCETSTETHMNPVIPSLGSKTDCCPVHVCVRSDGTKFAHYGLEGEGISGISGSYAQGTALNHFQMPPSPFTPIFPNQPPLAFFQKAFQSQAGPPMQPFIMNMNPNSFFGPGQGQDPNANNRINRNAQAPQNLNVNPDQEFPPLWDMMYNRERRDLPQPKFFRGGPFDFFGGQMQQAAFPPQF